MLVTDLAVRAPYAPFVDLVGGVGSRPSFEVGGERKVRVVQREDLVVAAEDDVALEPVDPVRQALLERGTGRFGAVVTTESVAVHGEPVCRSSGHDGGQDDPTQRIRNPAACRRWEGTHAARFLQ